MKQEQVVVLADTMYSTSVFYGAQHSQLAPNIEVVGGTVNVWGSQSAPDSPPTGMSETQAGFGGISSFAVVPNYMFFETASGTPVITLTGIKAATLP